MWTCFLGSVSYVDKAHLDRAQDVQTRLSLDVGYGAGRVKPGGHGAELACKVCIMAQSWIMEMRTEHASLGLDTSCGTEATSEYWVEYMQGRIRQIHQQKGSGPRLRLEMGFRVGVRGVR